MKQFFKTVFASAVGVLVAACVLVMMSVFFVLGLIASMEAGTYTPSKETVFKIALEGHLSDHADPNPFSQLMKEDQQELALSDLLDAIRLAKTNEYIKGIYLETGEFSAAPAGLESLRYALKDFKESGKFIVAYGDNYSQGSYYLCSVADSIFLNPQGTVGLLGFASQGLFFSELASKLGIEHYIFKVGTYKGAVEPYFLKKFSDANREQISSFLNNIWGHVTADIAKDRALTPQRLDQYINEGLAMGNAQNAIDYKLADALCYKSEMERHIKIMAGVKEDQTLAVAEVDKVSKIEQKEQPHKDQIAVLYAEGIIDKAASPSPFNSDQKIISEKMVKKLAKLAKDDQVKAVVLRVNSPGGSAFISEQIWKAVVDLKQAKPIVVSMGDYAASGGYYISCAANKIVAERNTLTGSIGVYGVVRNTTGLFNKIGLSTDIVKTNTYADLGDMSRPMRDDEKALIQRGVEQTYDLFLTRCAKGRRMDKAAIDSVGQGRVWTGEQALALGLVDKLGGLSVAIEEAAVLANLSQYSVENVSGSKSFITDFLDEKLNETKLQMARSVLGDEFELFQTLGRIKAESGIQARLPYDVQTF